MTPPPSTPYRVHHDGCNYIGSRRLVNFGSLPALPTNFPKDGKEGHEEGCRCRARSGHEEGHEGHESDEGDEGLSKGIVQAQASLYIGGRRKLCVGLGCPTPFKHLEQERCASFISPTPLA